ncbi:hypothetical protein [Actinophytocola sp.]|uniref:hypothetical protein n=1 Tax=Actinophytocola sp. TaxID=1872138 RepID=UPI003C71A275
MFDLISDDDVLRGQALTRHRSLVASDPAASSHWSDGDKTIFAYNEAFIYVRPGIDFHPGYWPFVMLYLWWEMRYPDEWRSRESNKGSPWTRKQVLLRQLGQYGMPEEVGLEAAELILAAIQRPYRCKDWMYALLVRHVADENFRDRTTALTDVPDPLVRLRARYILDHVDRPDATTTRRTWRRWLEHAAQHDRDAVVETATSGDSSSHMPTSGRSSRSDSGGRIGSS